MEKYTDQTFFYKQTPVNYDGIAKFTSIKGNTLVWNQLIQNGNFANSSSWVGQSATVSISNGVANVTLSAKGNYVALRQNYTGISKTGHKYFVTATIKSAKKTAVGFYLDGGYAYLGGYDVQANTLTKVYSLIDGGESGGFNVYVSRKNELDVGDVVQVSNVMLIDLTQMYGSGNEPTADEFLSLFSLPYYDYNQGTLIPFSGNGIKTTGKNLWKYIDNVYRRLCTLNNQDGTITVSATGADCYFGDVVTTGLSYSEEKGWLIDVSKINNIAIRTGNPLFWKNYITRYDANKVSLGFQAFPSDVFTADVSNCTYVSFRFGYANSVSGTDYIIKPQVEIGTQSTDFEPYTSSTLSLPISTYFPTGMKSAGTVYDELTETKAITRVSYNTITRSDITSASVEATNTFRIVLGKQAVEPNNAYKIGLSNKYTLASSYAEIIANDKTIGFNATGTTMILHDSSLSTVNDLYTMFSSFTLEFVYPLVAPTETAVDLDLAFNAYEDGTEQLLPVNGSVPSTSPIIADIEYYDSTEGDSLYRRFWLINGDGERWDLTDKEFKSFLNNPTGLGFRKTIEITRYGEKANKNNEVYDFPQPSGELLFYDTYNSTRYDKYNKFIRFLMSQPITLYYMIPVSYISGIANIFTLDCDVTEVQKTESKTDHILTSSIVFNGLGFYEGDEISINGTTDTYTLTNEGDFPVGFEITVEGNMTNPYITLSQDGELYGEAKFDSATAFNSLYIDSNDGEQNIILQQGGSVIPNPLSYQDLSISNGSIYVTFVKLAKGVSELSIGMESGSITNVNIKYSPKYRSV